MVSCWGFPGEISEVRRGQDGHSHHFLESASWKPWNCTGLFCIYGWAWERRTGVKGDGRKKPWHSDTQDNAVTEMWLSLQQSQSTTGGKKARGKAQPSGRLQFLLEQHQEVHSLSLLCSGSLVSGFSSTCKVLTSGANGTHKSVTRKRRRNLFPWRKYIQIQNDAEDCASWPTPPDVEKAPNQELLNSRRRAVQNVGVLDMASNWFGCVFSKSPCIRSLTLQIVMKR